MEYCYDYFNCLKKECPARIEKREDCWNLKDTLCGAFPCGLEKEISDVSKNKCEICLFYKKKLGEL